MRSRGFICLALSGCFLRASTAVSSRLNFAIFASVAMVSPTRRGLLLAEGHAEAPQQLAGLVVAVGGGDEGDVHALDEGHLVRVDLGEDLLLGQPEAVVAVPVEALGVDA